MSDFNQKWSDDLQSRLMAQCNEVGGNDGHLMAEAACCLKALSLLTVNHVWIACSERLPDAGIDVVLISESWNKPRVLTYQTFPQQRFLDAESGRWYWYPERMHWMPLPPEPSK